MHMHEGNLSQSCCGLDNEHILSHRIASHGKLRQLRFPDLALRLGNNAPGIYIFSIELGLMQIAFPLQSERATDEILTK